MKILCLLGRHKWQIERRGLQLRALNGGPPATPCRCVRCGKREYRSSGRVLKAEQSI